MSMSYFAPVVILLGLVPALEAGEKFTTKVYSVADLVVPIEGLPGMKSACPAAIGCAAATKVPDKNQTMHEALIKLICRKVRPNSWADVGGQASIDYFPMGMGLVVSQTSDAHEEIAELLNALRGLQDVQVVMEMRLVNVTDDCCERIGVDFNCPNAQVGSAVNGDKGLCGSVILNEAKAKPVFLNEKQLHAFLEAVQGDRRANVMQSPRLTTFNGQNAVVSIGQTQQFVTGMTVGEKNGQTVAVPKVEAFDLGTRLEVQPVVSADHQFVAIKLNCQIAEVDGEPELFPVITTVKPVVDGGAQGQPIPFTQFIQKPAINKMAVNKSACIPDGHTMVLMIGRTERQVREESQVPGMSRIPYMSRLFKNVVLRREAQARLLLVTPRIVSENREETVPTAAGACTGVGKGASIAIPTGGAVGFAIGCDVESKESCCKDSCCKACCAKRAACCSTVAVTRPSGPMNLADVVALSTSGISDDLIVNQMMTTGATFTLATEDILFLKKNKVSDQVVMMMQNSRPRPMPAATLPMPVPPMTPPMPLPYPSPQPYPALQYYSPAMPVMPIPAYPPPPATYAPPPAQCEPLPGGPNCLPVPVRTSGGGPIRVSFDYGVPASMAADEAGAAIGVVGFAAAVKFIDSLGELFGCESTLHPQPFSLSGPVPVQPWATERIQEKYSVPNEARTPILPPVGAKNDPACDYQPTDQEVLKALALRANGEPYAARDEIKIVRERMVDKIDAPRFFPLAGLAQLHHVHWKCTAYFSEFVQSSDVIPVTLTKKRVEVVYIDKDHLHMVGEATSKPQVLNEAAGEIGEAIRDAAIELIEGLGELFSFDGDVVVPVTTTLPSGQYLQHPPQYIPPTVPQAPSATAPNLPTPSDWKRQSRIVPAPQSRYAEPIPPQTLPPTTPRP
jgi:hypothetical protein